MFICLCVILVSMSERVVVKKKCELCLSLFIPKKRIVRFCSRECTNRWVNSLKNKQVEITCENTKCGKRFKRKPYLIKEINFCSRRCYDDSRAKPVRLHCFTCKKRIERLPREIHEKNFCSAVCQANAPKVTKQCSVCNKQITRRLTQTFENKTGNFYCSRECYFVGIRKNGSTHQRRLKARHLEYRMKALTKISPEHKCSNCGCDIPEILEINHINGGGKAEIRLKYHNIMRLFLDDIIHGTRPTKDLNLLCKICNALHYVETILGIKGFAVTFSPPTV